MQQDDSRKQQLNIKNKLLLKKLVILVACMFAFCFALVPIYSVLCKTTGLNGKTDGQVEEETYARLDTSRKITIEFMAGVNQDLPWEFKTSIKKLSIHPGQVTSLQYEAKNLTNKRMAVQAIPSVTPGLAAKHIKKIECFCFTRQELGPKESKVFPLKIVINPAISRDIEELTLAYTLFELDKE